MFPALARPGAPITRKLGLGPLREQTTESAVAPGDQVAIVGWGCLLPGAALYILLPAPYGSVVPIDLATVFYPVSGVRASHSGSVYAAVYQPVCELLRSCARLLPEPPMAPLLLGLG